VGGGGGGSRRLPGSEAEKAHEMRQVGTRKTVRSPRLGVAVEVS
jgi:hypothetical protein